jgi:hypothetical protein
VYAGAHEKSPQGEKAFAYACAVTAIVVSTIVYFVAAYFIKRHLLEMGIPRGITRGSVIFVGAAAIAYGAAYLVDSVVS